MRLRNFYFDSFAPLRLRSRTQGTKRLYLITLNNFEAYLGRESFLSDLTDDTVCAYLSWFRARGAGRSPYSVNKERNNLLAIWRWACKRVGPDGAPLVRNWPSVEPEVEPETVPLAWSRDELARLHHALMCQPGRIGGVEAPLWWATLHATVWDTGERISAIMDLTWCDVDLARGYIVVPAGVRKGRRKDKISRLHADSVAALQSLRDAIAVVSSGNLGVVFPWDRSRTYLWHKYGSILKAAGLPHDNRSKFHRLRRSVASYFEAAGGNATELLGHSNRKVTLRYLDPRIVGQVHASDLLFRPWKPGGVA